MFTPSPGQRCSIGRGLLATTLLVALCFARAEASTVAAFTWVEATGSGSGAESGTLDLLLPGTITSSQFSVATASASAAFADITSLQFTFSSGIAINLSNITSDTFTSATPTWATATVTNTTVGGTTLGTTDLITGFTLKGASSLKLAEAQSTLTNIQSVSAQINPASGGVANDSGYWELQSLTPIVVPLPAALPLLLSGIAGLGAIVRRRKVTLREHGAEILKQRIRLRQRSPRRYVRIRAQ
jgi:hypothetical protein